MPHRLGRASSLLVSALLLASCGARPATSATSPAASGAPRDAAAPADPGPASSESWHCFGLLLKVESGLQTSMCLETSAKCEALAAEFASSPVLSVTSPCKEQGFAFCHSIQSDDGTPNYQCSRSAEECDVNRQVQRIVGNTPTSGCQAATTGTVEYGWHCFRAAGPGGERVLCDVSAVACELTRAEFAAKQGLETSGCEPRSSAYCALYGASGYMCTPTEGECQTLRAEMAPGMKVPIEACVETKASCPVGRPGGACAK